MLILDLIIIITTQEAFVDSTWLFRCGKVLISVVITNHQLGK